MTAAARTRRIGVVADSHVGEYIDALPEGVLEALDGCDLILHAGDRIVSHIPGGGGYGNALEREREMIEKDLRNELISVEHARKYYGYEAG